MALVENCCVCDGDIDTGPLGTPRNSCDDCGGLFHRDKCGRGTLYGFKCDDCL
ncbi:hypothetical protein [Halorussus salinus]|uniref:hypothetical protein n=1 Tax=Halorussus salinus TaxID=1364935 RepID=UPI00138F4309|nr:hypothetical protein [Halorussus salinus]